MIELLPTLNALLNTTSAILLVTGHTFIKRGDRVKHKKFMLAALLVSALFLLSYLFYHYHHGSTPFQGTGWIRVVYFAILISHTVLATAIVPLVLITVRRGLKDRIASHKKIARWAYPIWLYVSVTGVIVYVMLYHF